MNILVLYDENQELTRRFREKGHNAFSCQEKITDVSRKEWHICCNPALIVNGATKFLSQNGESHTFLSNSKWDMIIGFPPTVYNDREDEKVKSRLMNQFMQIVKADCDKIMVLNQSNLISKEYKEPTQTVKEWWFGGESTKTIHIWSKGLKNLEQIVFSNKKNKNLIEKEPKNANGLIEQIAEQLG